MKNFLLGLAIVVVLLFGGIAVKVAFFPVAKIENVVDVTYDVNKEVMTKENAISSYKYFLDQAEAIKAKAKDEDVALKAIDSYKALLSEDKSKWTQSDRNELSRLQTVADSIYNKNTKIRNPSNNYFYVCII